jgi:4-alpha-glucanotransferase
MDLLNTLAGKHWKNVGIKHHHGINTPLFSLRSHNSCGIGEFLDLKLLIDWLSPLGFDVIQILPIYASGVDPSPYNALSANALNPIYISIEALPGIKEQSDLIEKIEELKKFNLTERIQYKEVRQLKEKVLAAYVDRKQTEYLADPEFIKFTENNSWIESYATFKALKTYYNWQDSALWPKNPDLTTLSGPILVHKIIQYIAYQQMESVKAYASDRQVFLMGDIPILVSPDSAEVWKNPELFDLNYSAGAPPDYYSKVGQNWGFPLYNYEALEKDQFQFWKQRLNCASRFYHIYRIDHIVGFFRIWGIPQGKEAKDGIFIPEDPSEWAPQGEKLLKLMIENASMLPIGEDLGIIPKEAKQTMRLLGIPGTKVIYWERRWKTDRSFIPFANYPANSLTTLSTHDSEPFPIWWETHPEDAKAFAAFRGWTYTPVLQKEQLFDILKASHQTSSLFHINLLQEYLNLTPELTWGRLGDERINIPGTVSPANWTYRYKYPIEEMAANQELSLKLRALLN